MDRYGILTPFSKTVLKEDSLFEICQVLELIPQNLKKENFEHLKIAQFQINPHLIREILFADALGLDKISAKSIIRCKGESLHLEKHTLVSVEAFKLVEQGHCLWLRRLFNMNYQKLPISKFLTIPSWMTYDYKNEVIVLEGIPSKLDINHILIRIFDQKQFATYQFHLKIEENPNQFATNNEDVFIKHQDEKTQNLLRDINGELQLKSTQTLQNRNRQSSLQNKSIFNVAYQLMKQKTSTDLIKESKESSINLQENKNNEQDEVNDEELIFQMREMDHSVKFPPSFSHYLKFQGDIQPINKQNNLLTTNQKLN